MASTSRLGAVARAATTAAAYRHTSFAQRGRWLREASDILDAELDTIPTRFRATREIERQALLAVLSHKAREESSQTPPHLPVPELIHYADLVATPLHPSLPTPHT